MRIIDNLIGQIQNLPCYRAILRHILDLHDYIGNQNGAVLENKMVQIQNCGDETI
jgi:hypothetical protein